MEKNEINLYIFNQAEGILDYFVVSLILFKLQPHIPGANEFPKGGSQWLY